MPKEAHSGPVTGGLGGDEPRKNTRVPVKKQTETNRGRVILPLYGLLRNNSHPVRIASGPGFKKLFDALLAKVEE